MSVQIVWPTADQFLQLVVRAGPEQEWVLDTETNGLEVRGAGAPNYAWYVGLMPLGTNTCLILDQALLRLPDVMDALEGLRLVGHNLRFDLHALGIHPKQQWRDTMLAAYFPNTTGRRALDFLSRIFGWEKIATPKELKDGRIEDLPLERLATYLADDCLTTAKLVRKLQMDRADFDYRVDRAVYEMECRGVRLLHEPLERVAVQLNEIILARAAVLRGEGFDGDPNSPKQVGSWLLECGRRLPVTKKGNTSTSKVVLQRMADDGDELADAILAWRKAVKLKSSFIAPLPLLARRGILYPQTNITRTKTGRFSCDSPNLQQIPKRGPLGNKIRGCLTSPENNGVTACDFSQIELRVAASLADEPVLLNAFSSGGDPHTEVAAKMLSKLPQDITPGERFKAKAVNFGILNGMGAKRLSIDLKSTHEEARRFLDEYRRSLPRLTTWMEGIWSEADAYKISRTVAGRTRPFRADEDTRSAISVVVQGSAAELMRHALVVTEEAGLKPLLSVHDEILIGGRSKGDELCYLMQAAADAAYPDTFNNVKFEASATEGATWGDV